MQGDLAGQYDGAGCGGQQQAAVEQCAQAGRGVGGDLAVGRAPEQPGEDVEGVGGDVVQERGHAGAVGEQGGERGGRGDRVGGRGQPDGGDDLLHPPRRHPGGGLGDGRTEPGRGGVLRGGREKLTSGTDEAQTIVRSPQKRLLAKRGDGAGQGTLDVGIAVVTGHEDAERVVRRRIGRDGQGLCRLQREPVQPLQGPHDTGPGGGPRGELSEIGGNGGDEVGSGAEQARERRVRTPPKILGEGAGRCGGGPRLRRVVLGAHPVNGSGWW